MKFKKKTICCFLYFILVFCKISDKYLSIIYFHFYLILNISVFALIFPHTYFFDTHPIKVRFFFWGGGQN